MTSPDNRPSQVRMTQKAMQTMIRMCRNMAPTEACGFVVAQKERPDLATRVVWMQNVDPKPTHRYCMDPNAIRQAYQEFDATDEEPLVVFHCHVSTEPVLSEDDLREVQDASLAFVVVSLMENKPKVRAYAVQRFIGASTAELIPIHVVAEEPIDVASPTGPWALMAGNRVRITYARQGVKALSTCVAWVTGISEFEVMIDPDHKTSPRMISMDRIRSVHVITEGEAAQRLRDDLKTYSRQAAMLLDWPDVRLLPSIAKAISIAFPHYLLVSMEKK